jgi:hypothetical protein
VAHDRRQAQKEELFAAQPAPCHAGTCGASPSQVLVWHWRFHCRHAHI